MSQIPINNTGWSGEYFVAAELIAGGTIGNARAVELFAKNEIMVLKFGWSIMMVNIISNCSFVIVPYKV